MTDSELGEGLKVGRGILHEHEKVQPGLLKTVIEMVQKENEHRRTLQNQTLQARIDAERRAHSEFARGQWFALAIVITAIGAGLWASLNGAQIAGGVIAGSPLVAVVGLFFQTRIANKEKEKETKDKEL